MPASILLGHMRCQTIIEDHGSDAWDFRCLGLSPVCCYELFLHIHEDRCSTASCADPYRVPCGEGKSTECIWPSCSVDIKGTFEAKGVLNAAERLKLMAAEVREPFPSSIRDAGSPVCLQISGLLLSSLYGCYLRCTWPGLAQCLSCHFVCDM
jgi:hypothetical protein